MLDAHASLLEVIHLDDASRIPEFFVLLSDQRIYKFLPAPPPRDMDDMIKRHSPQLDKLVFSAYLAGSASIPVGLLEIRCIEPGVVHIGYLFGVQYWGKGFSQVVIPQTIELARSMLGIRTVYAIVDSMNVASLRALEKCSFVVEEIIPAVLDRQATWDYVMRRDV